MEETIVQRSLLPQPNPNGYGGFFGYPGLCVEKAIYNDNAPMLRECIERDFIDEHSEMLDGKTILQHCAAEIERASVDTATGGGKPLHSPARAAVRGHAAWPGLDRAEAQG